MTTTADVIRAPRSQVPDEHPAWCLTCTGPLRALPDRLVPVFVHARHAAWAADPHPAIPVTSAIAPPVPGAWRELGMVDRSVVDELVDGWLG